MKGRIAYIDVAKGILILIVVLGHIPNHVKQGGIDSVIPFMDAIKQYDYWYIPFFMSGFFVITGFCSNHSRPFGQHLISNVKTTLLPAITICFLCLTLESLFSQKFLIYQMLNLRFLLFWRSLYWFFPALFIAKEIYWFLNHFVYKQYIIVLITLLLCFIGIALDKMNIPNFFYLKQSLAFVPCLMAGHLLKKSQLLDSKGTLIGWLYPLLIIVLHIIHIKIPGIGYHFRIELAQIPLWLLLAVLGVSWVLEISKKLAKVRFLAFLGLWSGFIYGFHFFAMDGVIKLVKPIFSHGTFASAIVLFLTIAILTLSICVVFIYLLDHKFTRIFLGKI